MLAAHRQHAAVESRTAQFSVRTYSKAALAGVAFMMGGGIMRTIAARPGSPLDIVPVDFVAHSLLRAASRGMVAGQRD